MLTTCVESTTYLDAVLAIFKCAHNILSIHAAFDWDMLHPCWVPLLKLKALLKSPFHLTLAVCWALTTSEFPCPVTLSSFARDFVI